MHVDVIGPHVQAGHYDLIGPNGEIILPAIWEKVIEPDWSVTMHMWPMEQRPPINQQMRPGGMGAPPGMHGAGARMPMHHPHGAAPAGRRPSGGAGGMPPGGPPPPPHFPPGMAIPIRPGAQRMDPRGMPPNVVNVVKPKKTSSSRAKPTVLGALFGKPAKPKK